MLNREYDRFVTCFDRVPVSFSGEIGGVGQLYDISYGGCKIKSRISPALGTIVTLRLSVGKGPDGLIIGGGTVAWSVPHQCFGIKFATLQPEEEQTLNRYLTLLNHLFLSPRPRPVTRGGRDAVRTACKPVK
jgi:hypothetical protein